MDFESRLIITYAKYPLYSNLHSIYYQLQIKNQNLNDITSLGFRIKFEYVLFGRSTPTDKLDWLEGTSKESQEKIQFACS